MFGKLKQLLNQEPSHNLWGEICAWIDQCNADLLDIAINYIQKTTINWPQDLDFDRSHGPRSGKDYEQCYTPHNWHSDILAGRDHPRHQLVRLTHMGGKASERVFECKHLSSLRFINLYHRYKPTGSFFKKLRNAAHLKNLTHLDMRTCTFSQAAVRAVDGASTVRSITHLQMAQCSFTKGTSPVDFLTQSLWDNLQYLDWSYISTDAGIAEAILAATNLIQLKHLNISGSLIDDREPYIPFLQAPHLSGLESLGIGSNSLLSCHAEDLAQASHLGSLRSLDISYSDFNEHDSASFLSAPHWTHLEKLTLTRTRLGRPGVMAIVKNPAFANLKELDLSDVGCTQDAALELLRAPQLTGLKAISLSENGLPSCVFDEIIKNTSLTALERISFHPIEMTEARWEALAATPHLKNLKYLYLGNNELLNAKARSILRSLRVSLTKNKPYSLKN